MRRGSIRPRSTSLLYNKKHSRPTTSTLSTNWKTRLLEFQDYQQIATPFGWKFTQTELNDPTRPTVRSTVSVLAVAAGHEPAVGVRLAEVGRWRGGGAQVAATRTSVPAMRRLTAL